MGCPQSKHCASCQHKLLQEESTSLPKLRNSMFIVQGLIGVGGFGEVLAVTLQQTGKWYALKIVNKVRNTTVHHKPIPRSDSTMVNNAGKPHEAQEWPFNDIWRTGRDVTCRAASLHRVDAPGVPRQVRSCLHTLANANVPYLTRIPYCTLQTQLLLCDGSEDRRGPAVLPEEEDGLRGERRGVLRGLHQRGAAPHPLQEHAAPRCEARYVHSL